MRDSQVRYVLRRSAVAWVATLACSASPIVACPVCDSGTGQQVRAGLMGPDLGWNLLAVLIPFPLLLAVVAAIHFGWPSSIRKRRLGGAAESELRHGD